MPEWHHHEFLRWHENVPDHGHDRLLLPAEPKVIACVDYQMQVSAVSGKRRNVCEKLPVLL